MVFIFLGELLVLFLLSHVVIRQLSFLFYRTTHSKKWSIRLLAMLFLPGTTVHELSHAVISEILFVRTRGITLIPQIEGDAVRLGSVQIEKTDFIRSFFIGIAPFIVGTGLILGLVWLTVSSIIPRTLLSIILVGYALFTISNTMFSSKRDLRGAIEFIILAVVIAIVIYFLGVRVQFTSELENSLSDAFKQAGMFLAIPLVINVSVIFLSKLLNRR